MNSWLSGSSKSVGWGGAQGLIGCFKRALPEDPGMDWVFMLLQAWSAGGYRNRPITSWAYPRSNLRLLDKRLLADGIEANYSSLSPRSKAAWSL